MRHGWSGKVLIKRADIEKIHDYAREHCTNRDYLIFRLPMKIGLRTGEIASLRIENINFDDRSFKVLDSKQKQLYPLPLDVVTLQLIQDLIGERREGYVFTHDRTWQYVKKDFPLRVQEIWHIIHQIGLKAGVEGFKPRDLRQYFAANWAHTERKSLPALQQILRHRNLETTSIYVGGKVFFEDVQREYDQIKNGPLIEPQFEEPAPNQAQGPHAKICGECGALQVCKYASMMPECVTACSHRVSNQTIRLPRALE